MYLAVVVVGGEVDQQVDDAGRPQICLYSPNVEVYELEREREMLKRVWTTNLNPLPGLWW